MPPSPPAHIPHSVVTKGCCPCTALPTWGAAALIPMAAAKHIEMDSCYIRKSFEDARAGFGKESTRPLKLGQKDPKISSV
ncbi:hypothetical protein NHJ6243_003753 [Beauveria neobassiana]